jgi:hypothetical protein
MTEIGGAVLQLVQRVLLKSFVETVLVTFLAYAFAALEMSNDLINDLWAYLHFPLLLSTVPQGIFDDETGCQRRTQLLTQSLCFLEDESDSDSSSRCAFSS